METDILTVVKYKNSQTVKGSIVFTLLWAQDIRIVVPLRGAFAQLCVCMHGRSLTQYRLQCNCVSVFSRKSVCLTGRWRGPFV